MIFESFDAVPEVSRPYSDKFLSFLGTTRDKKYFHGLFFDFPSFDEEKKTLVTRENDHNENNIYLNAILAKRS